MLHKNTYFKYYKNYIYSLALKMIAQNVCSVQIIEIFSNALMRQSAQKQQKFKTYYSYSSN